MIFLVILIAVFLLFFVSWILGLLWNSTMPDVFGLKSITYWQALRLLLISTILFGSHGMVRQPETADLSASLSSLSPDVNASVCDAAHPHHWVARI